MTVLADLVNVNVTSTGTGTLTLGSVVAGYLPFSVLPDGSVVSYGLTSNNQFEVGRGVIGGGGTTLTRDFTSSTTNALLNVVAGATVSIVPTASDIPPQFNMTATAGPTTANDSSQGYAIGSFWFRASTNQLWICQSATVGSAVWIPIVNAGSGKQSIYIPASAWYPRVTSGASVGAIETATNKINLPTLDFDPSTPEFAQFVVGMPPSWNQGTITFEVEWYHPTTTTNFGVTWSLAAMALSDQNAIDTALGTPVLVTDTGGTANTLYAGNESAALTVGNIPAQSDYVILELSRVTADAGDTLAVDARLVGVRIYYTVNANTDAPVTLNNLTATAGPNITNDSTQGYSVGSKWFWAARNIEWVCTDPRAGAARWSLTSSSSIRAGVAVAIPWVNSDNLTEFGCDFQQMANGQGRPLLPTNIYTRTPRHRSYSTTGIGQNCGWRRSQTTQTRRDIGFRVNVGFGVFDTHTTARMFIGHSENNFLQGTNAEPTTFTNIIGVGCTSGETTLSWLENDASGVATKTALGTGSLGGTAPINTGQTELYWLTIENLASGNPTMILERLSTGDVWVRTATTNIPGLTDILTFQLWRNSGANSGEVSLDFFGFSEEYL